MQERYADDGVKLPLCIMTSADTNAGTVKLLEENKYFGMDKEQVTLVQQGDGVPALIDNQASIALDKDDPYKIMTKPHGHGDVHALLYQHNVAKKWVADGIKWITFFQVRNLTYNSMNNRDSLTMSSTRTPTDWHSSHSLLPWESPWNMTSS